MGSCAYLQSLPDSPRSFLRKSQQLLDLSLFKTLFKPSRHGECAAVAFPAFRGLGARGVGGRTEERACLGTRQACG